MKKKLLISTVTLASLALAGFIFHDKASLDVSKAPQVTQATQVKSSKEIPDNESLRNAAYLIDNGDGEGNHFAEDVLNSSWDLPDDQVVFLDLSGGVFYHLDNEGSLDTEDYLIQGEKDGQMVTHDLRDPKQSATIGEIKEFIKEYTAKN